MLQNVAPTAGTVRNFRTDYGWEKTLCLLLNTPHKKTIVLKNSEKFQNGHVAIKTFISFSRKVIKKHKHFY